ncbi:TPA: phosphopyruvate hydratase [Candidatus Uhrbacteria bacterium]|nr:MAG: Enolase [Parcubacteria group bacterium GW2011_GWA2_53_21]OGL71785.1 MAG: phosphopyruvate hydratase [Candidatus Uhrbacteria bacterium RIFCSPHIGHO2_02_FULL_54_11]HBL39512.1 phosphopyruvate hydratase [Candidatus Uhrbacteria bacterium]
MSSNIKAIHAHEILDSRGNPTLSVHVLLGSGIVGSASVPSGTSTGAYEAIELRDGDKKRYGGKGVQKAIKRVRNIEKKIIGMSAFRQREIDNAMLLLDGTRNKSKLGANAILGVSLACAHAAAKQKKLPLYAYLRSAYSLQPTPYRLPYPMMNIMNGGAHAGWILDIQEFMLIPRQKSFKERVRCGAEIFHALGSLLKENGFTTLVGDEGGYAASLSKNQDVFQYLVKAARAAGYKAGEDVEFGIDAAASEFYDKETKTYRLNVEGKHLQASKLVDWYAELAKKYPLVSIEDPLEENDWYGWTEATKKLKGVQVVGDDLFVTDVERLRKGIEMKAGNAILIKPNQIGTLSETMDAILLAQANGYHVIISHRSGETTDTTIADLAIAVNADYIKAGSLSRGERVAKYNRLMEIEEELKYRL